MIKLGPLPYPSPVGDRVRRRGPTVIKSTSNHQLSQVGLTIGNKRTSKRYNITDLQSIRNIEKGGKLGRKVGSVKTAEQMKAEYREVVSLLRKGDTIRDVAKLCGKGVSTIQRVKRLIKVQSSQQYY